MRLILASTSPRRRELLALLGVPFEAVDPAYHESIQPGFGPDAQARLFAEAKARACAVRAPDLLVLGSDTLIAIDGLVLGKPADAAEARSMLRRLRGRQHAIVTAVALVRDADALYDVAVERVAVWMKALGDPEVDAYVATGEGLGKAGAYSIQGLGGSLIERIDGDYTAAVGFPLRLVARLLARRGVAVPVDVEALYRSRPYANWSRFVR